MSSTNKNKITEFEEEFDHTDLHNHILTRPDSYIGSLSKVNEELYVPKNNQMVLKSIKYVKGLFKIVDEVIVNARDQYVRLNTSLGDKPKKKKDIPVGNIWINVDRENGYISVKNDGNGIPIRKHSTEDIYIPELIFGVLLTSSNYKEDEKRYVGGKNGYGAKLCNIYSTEFYVETVDHERKKKFSQTYRNNMFDVEKEVITSNYVKDPYTIIKFKPDFKKFGITGLSEDFEMMIKGRAYDLAGCTDEKVNVYFNDELIPVKNFEDYVKLHFPEDNQGELIYKKFSNNWEIAISPNFSTELTGKQISFVNGARTIKGGKHVDYIFKQLYRGIQDKLKKRKLSVKESVLRYNMMIFVNCTINSPEFGGQTKEELTTQIRDIYPTCSLGDKFINDVYKTSIIENSIKFGKATDEIQLGKVKTDHRGILRDIPKLDDARLANTKDWEKCTLIITEGDSAKAMVLKAIPNKDYFGVFPIRGKLLNVVQASNEQLNKNAEVTNIRRILGIKGNKYKKGDKLRYGRLMIMTDQDLDGAHIKGLVLNYLKFLNLDKFNNFASTFLTPIVKATKSKKTKAFYSSQEFEKWLVKNENGKGWKIKYYKGLGTSNDKEAKEYFKEFDKCLNIYTWDTESDNSLSLVFSKNRADDRKEWLKSYDPKLEPDFSSKVSVTDFINKEFIHFSNYDNVRSINCSCDGLKPSQRKILHTVFKEKIKNEIKVAQLGSKVSEKTGYHHGEVSLYGTIVNMAQNIVGTNNINLMIPSGQFGSRLQNGKDAAQPRYIFTYPAKITPLIFNSDDNELLKPCFDDDGNQIEPEWFCPVIPMCLVNGTEGIGTGFSTGLPPFNPKDIINNLKRMMDGNEPIDMIPWYRGFSCNNKTKKIGKNKFAIFGKYTSNANNDTLHISELPIGTSVENYYDFLSKMIPNKKEDKKIKYRILSYDKGCAGNKIDILITFEKDKLCQYLLDQTKTDKDGFNHFEKNMNLSTTVSFNGKLVLRNKDGGLTTYESPIDVLKEYYNIRLDLYQKRKNLLLKKYLEDTKLYNVKAEFVSDVIEGKIIIVEPTKKKTRSKADITLQLEKRNYPKMLKINSKDKLFNIDEIETMSQELQDNASYDYLFKMQIYTLTKEKVEELLAEKERVNNEYKTLKNKTPKDLWKEDLLEVEAQYDEDLKEFEKQLKEEVGSGQSTSPPSSKKANLRKKAKMASS